MFKKKKFSNWFDYLEKKYSYPKKGACFNCEKYFPLTKMKRVGNVMLCKKCFKEKLGAGFNE